jgi:hypothetical protein
LQQLDVTVSVLPNQFVFGQPVSIMITVANRSHHTIERNFPTLCQVGFKLIDREGIRLTPQPICGQAVTKFRLDSNETRVSEHEWDGRSLSPDIPSPLPPGRYWIVGGVYGRGFEFVDVSDPVPVEIVAR